MNDTPTAAPMREDNATRIAHYFIEAEGAQIVRDIASHVGDEIHQVLKRHGMTMTTAAGAIGVGALAGVQVLNETLGFAVRSVDTEAEKASIAAGVAALVGTHLDHRLVHTARPDAGDDNVERLAQFLHDEGGFGDAMIDRIWPEHPDDTGQRGGGYVKIVPADVQAQFRDVARRWLLPRADKQSSRGFSRFDPSGFWESEPRSSADDAGTAIR